MTPAALEGLRVLELGDFISAAYGAKMLADLGADIVKVETPAGDTARAHGPFPGDEPHLERSGLFLFLNANKRGAVLDADTPQDREGVRELAAWADVVIHNLPPARLEALGFDHETLAADHPELVTVSITSYGYDTARRDWVATALTATAASGLAHRMGDPGRSPLWLPYCAADFQAGAHGAVAAMYALRARRLSGRGQHAWISSLMVLATYMGGARLESLVFDQMSGQRSGSHVLSFYPWQVAATKDGYFEVITMVDEQWARFLKLMGDPDWKDDPRLADRWTASQHAAELDPFWHPWMREHTNEELAEMFREQRISFQPIHTVKDAAEATHLQERHFWQDVRHPAAGAVRVPGAPYRLSETPYEIRRPAPLLGEHTSGVLKEARERSPGPAAAGSAERVRPMQGIRVLDHGHVWAGPLLASMFADMGAEVLKIQSPSGAAGVAMAGQRPGDQLDTESAESLQDDSRAYHGFDRGKLGVTLDLADPRGKALYKRLVEASDVIVENFSPRVMPGLGLGYDALSEVNPRIILASLSATGATGGPWGELVTYGPSLAALYGVKSLLGYADDPHPREDTADLDPTAAAHAFVAIAAALEYRERSGRGQFVDMAQGEAAMQRIAEPLIDYAMNGRVAGPQGNRYPGVAPHGIYRAAGEDSWIAIVARDDQEWASLLEVAAGSELQDARFADLAGRLANQDALDEAIERWTTKLDAGELTEQLQAAGVPSSPVMDSLALLADENFSELRSRNTELVADTSVTMDKIYQGVPWKLTATPAVITGPEPLPGQHNRQVFGGLLGLSDAEVEDLREAGVI